jgi:hypothetical protein
LLLSAGRGLLGFCHVNLLRMLRVKESAGFNEKTPRGKGENGRRSDGEEASIVPGMLAHALSSFASNAVNFPMGQ